MNVNVAREVEQGDLTRQVCAKGGQLGRGRSSGKRIFFKESPEPSTGERVVDSDYLKARVHMSANDYHNSVLRQCSSARPS